MDKVITGLKLLSDVVAAAGVILPPGLYQLTFVSPPMLGDYGLVAAALALFVFILVLFAYRPAPEAYTGVSHVAKWAAAVGCVFVVALLCFIFLLRLTTVREPQKSETRYQIGFGTAEWNLTELGQKMKRSRPNDTVVAWMEMNGAFSDDGPEKLWQPWAISLAGVSLVALYLLIFVCWAWAWALLAKHFSLMEPRPPGGPFT